jgi:hypothetical protein
MLLVAMLLVAMIGKRQHHATAQLSSADLLSTGLRALALLLP